MKTIKLILLTLTSTGPIGRWLRRKLALDRRYGVRFGSGNHERMGFYTSGEAKDFLADRNQIGVIFYYDPMDLRIGRGESVAPPVHYVGG